ncbi:MAG: AbiV family abortive infection protein [Haloechinothrix sp.]
MPDLLPRRRSMPAKGAPNPGRRQLQSTHWPEDFTERKRLAARYGIAAADNALAFLEEADVLLEANVLEETDDELEEDDEELEDVDETMFDGEAGDDALDEAGTVDGAEVFQGDHARARAFALTVFGAEEVAKAYVSSLVLRLHDDQDPSAWEAFWDIIRGRHQDKLQAALSLEQVLPRLAGTRHDDLARSLRNVLNEEVFRQRNLALYVDVVDGALETPDQLAKKPEVSELRAALAKSMVTWAIIIQGSLERSLEELDRNPD